MKSFALKLREYPDFFLGNNNLIKFGFEMLKVPRMYIITLFFIVLCKIMVYYELRSTLKMRFVNFINNRVFC